MEKFHTARFAVALVENSDTRNMLEYEEYFNKDHFSAVIISPMNFYSHTKTDSNMMWRKLTVSLPLDHILVTGLTVFIKSVMECAFLSKVRRSALLLQEVAFHLETHNSCNGCL